SSNASNLSSRPRIPAACKRTIAASSTAVLKPACHAPPGDMPPRRRLTAALATSSLLTCTKDTFALVCCSSTSLADIVAAPRTYLRADATQLPRYPKASPPDLLIGCACGPHHGTRFLSFTCEQLANIGRTCKTFPGTCKTSQLTDQTTS